MDNLDQFIAYQNSVPASSSKLFNCPKCDSYSAPTQAILKLHMASMHPLYRNTFLESTPEGFPCPECGKLFETVNKKNRHFKNVHGEKNLICPHCPYRTGRKDNFVVHMRKQHPGKDMTPGKDPEDQPVPSPSDPASSPSPSLFPQIGMVLPQAMLIQQLKILQTLKLLKDKQEAATSNSSYPGSENGQGSPPNPWEPEVSIESGEDSKHNSLNEFSLEEEPRSTDTDPDPVNSILSAALGPMGPREVERVLTRKRKMSVPKKAAKLPSEPVGEGESTPQFKCSACKFIASKMANVRCHISQTHLKHCSAGEAQNLTVIELKASGDTEGVDEELLCDECDFLAANETQLEDHKRSSHFKRSKLYQCKVCEYSSVHSNNVKDHEKAIHDKIRDFSCNVCDYKASHKMTVVHHIKGVHLKIKEYSCQHCDFQASYRSTIRNHVHSIHLTNKDFACKICPYKATSKRYVIDHIKGVHLRTKDKSCKHCLYKCTHAIDLRRHLAKAHDEPDPQDLPNAKDISPDFEDCNADDLVITEVKDESGDSVLNTGFKKNDMNNIDIDSMITEITEDGESRLSPNDNGPKDDLDATADTKDGSLSN
ncbi:zinc finger protein 142-like [Tigriopus californicus]|nr:zinc finger protein 142-like [Tigriopus californicus]|eukprot:TCALIF_11914-PA protein Name:"Similar to Rest RE1-silencing transcription factor (Mus musculus)" AED:0.12 eAED:0.13 QI:0/-1/0/1/-1/1/1/0/595